MVKGRIFYWPILTWADFGLTNKRQEVSRRDKKRQEASRTYFGVVLSFKCYILTNYDIRKVLNIIL